MSTSTAVVEQRLAATREFAHTMIVVDDEAWKIAPPDRVPRAGLRTPRRGSAIVTESTQQEMFAIRHALDTEVLVNAAMDLGLICSVVRPPKGKSIKAKVGSAATRADIVCLDWELHGDGGESATQIIAEILRSDEKRSGRLRLIAIYTGDMNNNQILDKVFNALPKSYRDRHDLTKSNVCIESNHGLRIVCLFKAHGVQLTDSRQERQVKERDLPDRLQREFALLAGGLLSNVALATIASIRDSTHHVLAKMTKAVDAPYFHHRSILPMVSDAEEYSVDVVLSDLKSEIDKHGVAQRYAGPEAIAARIREMAQGATTFRLHYNSGGKAKDFDVSVDDTIRLITDGNIATHAKIVGGTKPSIKAFERGMCSLFTTDAKAAQVVMRQFAALTGVRAHPGSHLYRSGKQLPQLGLGTVLRDEKDRYLLCLQASCDAVRVRRKRAGFLFVPLARDDEIAEHFVPVLMHDRKVEFIGLSTPGTAYAELFSIPFDPNETSQTVVARKLKRRRGLFFVAANNKAYRWIADLKQRRALRTAQRLGQSMGRMGFDEFEPFRPRDD
ncbi:MAG: hypothetical protein EPO55_10230 [Reyranella sp.]|uniref:response regulator receiver domain n=1 Tax=Reyranella sp. TaxID=1929291 RepID=UPI0012287983|nr:response regulator receiver domain [Reyranella sp.]TAJ40110.1 MAG: hypothetical protein EPO55_10230 [Reyranella sp.]